MTSQAAGNSVVSGDDPPSWSPTSKTCSVPMLELWRGEPTGTLAESWAVHPTEQRRVRFSAIAVRTGELLLARHQADRAREFAERALAADPWLEAAHRLVITTHRADCNDDVAARRALDRYRASIVEGFARRVEAVTS